jgi:hypothetical protein
MSPKTMHRKALFAVMAMSAAWALLAHSPAETNNLVRGMLASIVFAANDNLLAGRPWIGSREAPVTWPGFLGRDESHGWTLAEKKAAFAWYLSTLGTTDCKSLSALDRQCVRVALDQCRTLNYTEAASSLKALALNPRGICRDDAIELAIRYGTIDDSMTIFVESIITNSGHYSFRERGRASDQYAWRLFSFNATNSVQREIRDAGVRMFYRNRLSESGETSMVDKLFLKYIDGYGSSSNRLIFAINSFSYPVCSELFGEYFTSVTNQLLSSGRPLVQLDIGEGGD